MVSRFAWRAASVLAALVLCSVSVPALAADSGSAGPPAGVEPRIVGGEKASTEQYPYAVYLVTDRGYQFCGGVLVDHDSVVTAAHCAEAVAKGDLGVVAGRTDKRSEAGVRVDVTEVWVHPDFEAPWEGDDIAVLTLRHPVAYEPAGFADAEDAELYQPGTMATVVGWGRIAEDGPRSHVLRSAEVPLVSDADCEEAFTSYQPEEMVCAGFVDGGVDACQGDSGGPLLVDGKVVGIVSWGRGCARPSTPGVYTRVSSYAEQIAQHAESPGVLAKIGE